MQDLHDLFGQARQGGMHHHHHSGGGGSQSSQANQDPLSKLTSALNAYTQQLGVSASSASTTTSVSA
ncbi:MAG: hypothetical protein JOZ05_07130 [Acetobacteraceae bacterium]|nr:hypothetical protein [Acetobacteraceae bacterium]